LSKQALRNLDLSARQISTWESVRDMAKQTRRSRKKKNKARPVSFLLGLRKKLGIKTLLEVKRQALHKALAATKGDKALAAALLGIGKTTLYRSLAE